MSVLVAGADLVPAEAAATTDPRPELNAPQIFDPRLSTTYNAEGAPLRAGIELWLGADEDRDHVRYGCQPSRPGIGSPATSETCGSRHMRSAATAAARTASACTRTCAPADSSPET